MNAPPLSLHPEHRKILSDLGSSAATVLSLLQPDNRQRPSEAEWHGALDAAAAQLCDNCHKYLGRPPIVPSKPDPEDFERLILFTIRGLGLVRMTELLPAFWAIAPGLAAETLHDSLNNLLADGKLRLSSVGCYYLP